MEKEVNILLDMIDKTFNLAALMAEYYNESPSQAIGKVAVRLEGHIPQAKHRAILAATGLGEKIAASKDVSAADLVTGLVELSKNAKNFASLLQQANNEVFSALHKTGMEQTIINERMSQMKVIEHFNIKSTTSGPVVDPRSPDQSNGQGKGM